MIKLYKGLKPFKWLLLLTVIIITAKSMADLFIPELLKEVVKLIPTIPGTPAPVSEMIAAGSIALLAVLGVVLAEIIISYLASKIAFGFGKNLRQKLFDKIQTLSEEQLGKIGNSSLITRTINDVNQLQQVTMIIIRMMISAPIMLVGGAFFAYRLDAQITLVILGVLPVLIAMVGYVGLKVVPIYKRMQKALDKLTLVSKENITGVRIIRAFNNEELEREKFNEQNKLTTSLATSANRYMSVTMPVVSFMFNLVILLIIWFGATGAADFANINAIMQYSMRIMMSFIMLIMMFIFVPRASASATRINEVLDLEVKQKQVKKSKKQNSKTKGKIEFKNVTFKFEGANEPAIKDVSFVSNAGQTTAIIGGTGSGKSTIINLIPRFLDSTKGQILIDDVDVTKLTLHDLRNKMAIVPQKAVLFNLSILDNIKYSNKSASIDEVKKAAEIAQAKDFIEQEKGGYNYLVEKGGANLSGGQKQRLSIARAIVKKPEIYIFDDSFSALDSKTEARLKNALNKETSNSSILIVAQKISSIKQADQIIVLNDGEVAGIGKHEDLLKTCTTYKEIYNSQNKREVK